MKQLPDAYFAGVSAIPPLFLQQHGITGLAMDIDNTLTVDGDAALPPHVAQWLSTVKEAGIAAVVVSNNSEMRVSAFATLCGLPYIAKAKKPSQHAVSEILRILQATPQQTAFIGDQWFTDMKFGMRAGFFTILVDKMGRDALVGIMIRRIFERPFRRRLLKRGRDASFKSC